METQQNVVIYQNSDGKIGLNVELTDDTVWLSQKQQMEQLFGRERSVITKHINNVFKEGELERDAVCANFAHTAEDGKIYQVQYYNLGVIISVGYRVKSQRDRKDSTSSARLWNYYTSLLKKKTKTLSHKRLL